MKKLTIALVTALVMGLAAPAMAASGLAISGELGSDFSLDKDGVGAESYFDIDFALKGEGGDQVKAVIELKPWSIGNTKSRNDDSESMEWDKVNLGDWTSQQADSFGLTVKKAYLQAEGAYWNGGPSLTTTIGDISLDQNDYVAGRSAKGVMIEGIQVGPVAAETFATFVDGSPANLGLSARTDLQFAEIGGTVVRLADKNIEFGVDGSTQIAGVGVTGEFAMDAAEEYAYKVRGSVEPIEGVVLSGGYRGVSSEAFAPAMHKTDNSNTYPDEWKEVHDRKTGFDVAVETTQAGVDLKAAYDDPDQEATLEARRAFDVAGLIVNGKYEGTMNVQDKSLTHEISADTTLSMIPQLQNVTLEGGLTIADSSVSQYEAHAKYAAPNGINFGAHYEKEAGQEADIYGTAGVSVKF